MNTRPPFQTRLPLGAHTSNLYPTYSIESNTLKRSCQRKIALVETKQGHTPIQTMFVPYPRHSNRLPTIAPHIDDRYRKYPQRSARSRPPLTRAAPKSVVKRLATPQ